MLLLSPTASAVKFHNQDDHLFRINATTRDNGRNYAEHYYARRASGASRWRSIRTTQASPRAGWQEFRRAYEAVGGRC